MWLKKRQHFQVVFPFSLIIKDIISKSLVVITEQAIIDDGLRLLCVYVFYYVNYRPHSAAQ